MREAQRSAKRSGKRLNECFDIRSGKRSGRTLTLEHRGSRTGDKVYSLWKTPSRSGKRSGRTLTLEHRGSRTGRPHPFFHGPTKQAVGE